ncbi:hypothetical protein MG293_002164 [Ovis ammon polii]|uniref:Uncharacterized protein n=1 Tax=Ovis ammon polii TaxID=230172 RepID=A0AAD4YIM1_OVIAM|nr:hypothetical protein MG293_002164 [Ovis ammon polii]
MPSEEGILHGAETEKKTVNSFGSHRRMSTMLPSFLTRGIITKPPSVLKTGISETYYFPDKSFDFVLLGENQGSLEGYRPWSHKESDTAERLNSSIGTHGPTDARTVVMVPLDYLQRQATPPYHTSISKYVTFILILLFFQINMELFWTSEKPKLPRNQKADDPGQEVPVTPGTVESLSQGQCCTIRKLELAGA